jgi:GT2 family glycosyltransferase
MLEHLARNGHGIVKGYHLNDEEFIRQEQAKKPRGVIITLGCLCWNTKDVTVQSVKALILESERLRSLGNTVHVAIVDNGSTDGTPEALGNLEVGAGGSDYFVQTNPTNEGISIGRNQLVEQALEWDSDYILLIDGDIEVVPFSTYVMAQYMEAHKVAGCIGAYSGNFTRERLRCTKYLHEIDPAKVKGEDPIAWTQYGLFRCSMFKMGLRFEDEGPFGDPGWGFEDVDFALRMQQRGWDSRHFTGMCYLHRNVRSSWESLANQGINIQQAFYDRKNFLLKRWRGRLDPSRLLSIEAQQLPG